MKRTSSHFLWARRPRDGAWHCWTRQPIRYLGTVVRDGSTHWTATAHPEVRTITREAAAWWLAEPSSNHLQEQVRRLVNRP